MVLSQDTKAVIFNVYKKLKQHRNSLLKGRKSQRLASVVRLLTGVTKGGLDNIIKEAKDNGGEISLTKTAISRNRDSILNDEIEEWNATGIPVSARKLCIELREKKDVDITKQYMCKSMCFGSIETVFLH